MEIQENGFRVGLLQPRQLLGAVLGWTGGVSAVVTYIWRSQSSCLEAQQRYLELQCDQNGLGPSTECPNLKMIQAISCYPVLQTESLQLGAARAAGAVYLTGLAYLVHLCEPQPWVRVIDFIAQLSFA